MRKRTVDLVFANEAELGSLYETADFDAALAQFRKDVAGGVVTRSEKGCVVVSKDGVEAVPAFPVDKVVDTTGAGDLFAAGFLFGQVREFSIEEGGTARCAGGGGGDPAPGRPAANLAQGAGAGEGAVGVKARRGSPFNSSASSEADYLLSEDGDSHPVAAAWEQFRRDCV